MDPRFTFPTMKQTILLIASLTTGFLLILALRPIEPSTLSDCIRVDGIIAAIDTNGGPSDVSIYIKGDNSYYYINRGLEKGLQLGDLQSNLVGQHCTLFYADHWTPLDPFGTHRHVTKIQVKETAVYNEVLIGS